MIYTCSVCKRNTPREDAPEGRAGLFCPFCHCLFDRPPQLAEPEDRLKAAINPIVEATSKARQMASLFEEFFATLEVNRLRGVISATNTKDAAAFADLIAAYRMRFEKLLPEGYQLSKATISPGVADKVDFG